MLGTFQFPLGTRLVAWTYCKHPLRGKFKTQFLLFSPFLSSRTPGHLFKAVLLSLFRQAPLSSNQVPYQFRTKYPLPPWQEKRIC